MTDYSLGPNDDYAKKIVEPYAEKNFNVEEMKVFRGGVVYTMALVSGVEKYFKYRTPANFVLKNGKPFQPFMRVALTESINNCCVDGIPSLIGEVVIDDETGKRMELLEDL